MTVTQVHIIGAGLAGSEAAYYLAKCGINVILYEMRPHTLTPAHQTAHCAELVCSNSLKSKSLNSAPGMLKTEMKALGSLVLEAAQSCEVPGGEALAVDRNLFSQYITQKIKNHPKITLKNQEIEKPFLENDAITLIATGPLTSPKLTQWMIHATGEEDLYFYDAIAPIIDAQSLDREHLFLANRYDKGEEVAYLNCPLTENQYEKWIDALLIAEKVEPKNFEKEILFQGCQPIESIAAKGKESLRYGPMKPVGLTDPKTGKTPYAVLQLRPENKSLTAYNLVGFQTKLKYGEQLRIFRMIAALKNAEFLRLGSIHRNTYVCGPKVLRSDLSFKKFPRVYLAGQITGVEGYVESSACGLLAAIFISQRILGLPHEAPPANTMLGALLRYVTNSNEKHYQPSNVHFGLLNPEYFSDLPIKNREKAREIMSIQAKQNFHNWWAKNLNPFKNNIDTVNDR